MMSIAGQPGSLRIGARPTGRALPLAVVVAVVASTIVDSVVALIAHGAGASHGFRPLEFPTYTALTVVGVVLGALAWQAVRSRSRRPAEVLRRLVPGVLALSFVPDILVGVTKSQAHTSWGAVAALMVMHLVVGSVAVLTFATLLPVRPTDRP
jgi:hypothetical protein